MFVPGDGGGGSEKRIGEQTGNNCIAACISLKKKDNKINGVTIRRNGKAGCWCEYGMTKVAGNKNVYKTCFLKVKGKEASFSQSCSYCSICSISTKKALV